MLTAVLALTWLIQSCFFFEQGNNSILNIDYQVIVIVHGESGYLSLHAQGLPLQLQQTLELANRLAVTHVAATQLRHLGIRCWVKLKKKSGR